jgi:hypothetical protein
MCWINALVAALSLSCIISLTASSTVGSLTGARSAWKRSRLAM